MLFRSPQSAAARTIFDDQRQMEAMLRFEAALARAEARCGIVPEQDAEAITRVCDRASLDIEAIQRESAQCGNAAIPLIRQLTRRVAAEAPGAERFVHWGATSQDVIDTAIVLQLRELFGLTVTALDDLCTVLASLCEKHAGTIMAGRTWLQQAVPISFGLKLAGTLDALLRHHERLIAAGERTFVLQFGGAAGTLASLGDSGEQVAALLADELGLALPSMPWHTQRDRFVEVACVYAGISNTVAKLARDLGLLMQTEVAEVTEGTAEGKGGSSTMPHKRNPVGIAAILTSTARIPGLLSTLLTSTAAQEHERGLTGWQIEWDILPELCTATESATEAMTELLQKMSVDAERMRANLQATNGLILAEAISMALADKLGKAKAYALVERIARAATASQTPFPEALSREPAVSQLLSWQEINSLLIPERYLGSSSRMIARVLATYRTSRTKETDHRR